MKASFLLCLLVLAGCASTAPQDSTWSNRLREKVAACIAATRQTDLVVVDVPAARNTISNKMAIATLSMGGSNSVDALVQILSEPTRSAVAVIGINDEMTAATLAEAIKRLSSGTKRSSQPVCFVGEKSLGISLKTTADHAGVPVVLVPNP